MDQLLKQFNLSPEEIKVYKILLKTGGAKASAIAKISGAKRTSCREYIVSLEQKGLINSTKIGNTFFYQAEDPDRFRQIIEERNWQLDRLWPELKNVGHSASWQVRTMTPEEQRIKIKRASKKESPVVRFGDDTNGGAVVGESTVLLHSDHQALPALEIVAAGIAEFHLALLKKK